MRSPAKRFIQKSPPLSSFVVFFLVERRVYQYGWVLGYTSENDQSNRRDQKRDPPSRRPLKSLPTPVVGGFHGVFHPHIRQVSLIIVIIFIVIVAVVVAVGTRGGYTLKGMLEEGMLEKASREVGELPPDTAETCRPVSLDNRLRLDLRGGAGHAGPRGARARPRLGTEDEVALVHPVPDRPSVRASGSGAVVEGRDGLAGQGSGIGARSGRRRVLVRLGIVDIVSGRSVQDGDVVARHRPRPGGGAGSVHPRDKGWSRKAGEWDVGDRAVAAGRPVSVLPVPGGTGRGRLRGGLPTGHGERQCYRV
ncbi:hypothetical protein GGR56DRAFT_197860 [Xylariaceae sp. FL0804]|nr:hypothetical protein GGR56DRAFT_197860 [Xylariaceae sp. FL0804]